ncbi:hypothetical protein KVV02_006288 [Mortierella alpina]|uniref:Uncharacterized protein n=1 Tax=Mortierella alpina TaxID=64518 RepID=A0A9P8A7W3_MORAP|nr:hypothetical protein KVV02_006288 [Mortierella alpina]
MDSEQKHKVRRTAKITLFPTKGMEVRSSMMEQAWIVSYRYRHNHTLEGITDIGSGQKAAAIRATVRSLILEGSAAQRVVQQLTMEYDKFTRIMSDNGQQLSRVHFITYDDVYNTVNKAMRKDPDPLLSCIKWMEDFEENDAFTYYNRDDRISGAEFGFASLWQLRQLKAYGRVVCLDGHNAFG